MMACFFVWSLGQTQAAGERALNAAWKEVMKTIEKRTTDSPQTWEAKNEDFNKIIGPAALESMGIPTEQIILTYRLLLAHCHSFHKVVKEMLQKRRTTPPPSPSKRLGQEDGQTAFEKAMDTLSDPEELRKYPRVKVRALLHPSAVLSPTSLGEDSRHPLLQTSSTKQASERNP